MFEDVHASIAEFNCVFVGRRKMFSIRAKMDLLRL